MSTESIYAISIDGTTIYIGRSVDPTRRYLEHLRENSGSPKCEALKLAKQKGQIVKLEIIVTVARGSLGDLEDVEIQKIIDSGGKLTNLRSGDRGIQLTAAQAHQLNKDVQHWKITSRPKKGDIGEGWSPEKQKRTEERYAAYKAGLLSLEELKAGRDAG